MELMRRLAVPVFAAAAFARTGSAQDLADGSQLVNWRAPVLWSLSEKAARDVPDSPPTSEPLSAEALPTPALPFVGVAPCRLADTRGNGFTGQFGPPVVTTAGRTIPIVGQCGIPASAQAVSFNFTAANISAAGFLVTFPAGGALPPVATMAYNQNTPNLSNAAVVTLGTGGAITVVAGVTPVDVIVDVNGYYGPNLESICVTEGEANSISSGMIADGTIVNADINASAAIADTKLATISTAGKVADSALSANVSKLGQSIETVEISDNAVTAPKIANVLRVIHIPLTSFVDCTHGEVLTFTQGMDNRPNYFLSPDAGGNRFRIVFDAVAGSPDSGTQLCSQFVIPPDFVDFSSFNFLIVKPTGTGVVETLSFTARKYEDNTGAVNFNIILPTGTTHFSVNGTGLDGFVAGDTVQFFMGVSGIGAPINDAVGVGSVAIFYEASQ